MTTYLFWTLWVGVYFQCWAHTLFFGIFLLKNINEIEDIFKNCKQLETKNKRKIVTTKIN